MVFIAIGWIFKNGIIDKSMQQGNRVIEMAF